MARDNARIKICEWNIHHQGGCSSETTPGWVVAELKDQDIVVLTEFPTDVAAGSAAARVNAKADVSSQSRKLVFGELQKAGFACFPSNNQDGNDVLIAIKESLITESKPEFHCCNPYCNEDQLIPENAIVELKIGDRDLVVVGVRIRTLEHFKARKAQFESLVDELKKLSDRPVLIAGDWNHGKVGSADKHWSLELMERRLGELNYSVSPKKGSSIFQENGYCDFPDDHFIVNQAMLCLEEVKYDRGFAERHSSIYKWGRNFCNWPSDESVRPPYPDHAMLKATLAFAN